jgi:hypothetical protein
MLTWNSMAILSTLNAPDSDLSRSIHRLEQHNHDKIITGTLIQLILLSSWFLGIFFLQTVIMYRESVIQEDVAVDLPLQVVKASSGYMTGYNKYFNECCLYNNSVNIGGGGLLDVLFYLINTLYVGNMNIHLIITTQ